MSVEFFCVQCNSETGKLGFNCLKCQATYCKKCVGPPKKYGEAKEKEFRCPSCGKSLYFHLPIPPRLLLEEDQVGFVEPVAQQKSSSRNMLSPNKRARRPSGVKRNKP